jgi:putative ABC transport system permease protein
MRLAGFVDSVVQDIRYAARGFLRTPAFTIAAVLAIALGIGATTAVFSVVDRILFRALPYRDAGRLVSVGLSAPIEPNEFMLGSDYVEWRVRQTPFESITSWSGVADCDLSERNPLRLGCANVEQNFLTTFGIQPILGRNFTPEEDRPHGPKVALISYSLWRSRFASDSGIVGRSMSLDGEPTTIIGVLPQDFEVPTLAEVGVVLPQALDEAAQRRPKTGRVLRSFARLKPGITISQARAALDPLFTESLNFVPQQFRKEVRLSVRTLRDRQFGDARLAATVLLAAVFAVLLIACADVANLLLARAAAREREMAVRAALGAHRGRLARQLLTESLLLGLVGGIAGCALAFALLRIFTRIAPQGIPRLQQASIDFRVLLFTAAAALTAGFLAGLAPALHRPRAESLSGARTVGATRSIFRSLLVAAQIATSVILLAAAGLLLRSLWNLQQEPLGISTDRVMTAEFVLSQQLYAKPEQQLAFFEQAESRIAQIPGMVSVALADTVPPSGRTRTMLVAVIDVDGKPSLATDTGGSVVWRAVTPNYFSALNIPIVRGRGFTEEDRSPSQNALVLSQSLARRLFPDQEALGQRVRVGRVDPWYTVVGVARDVKNGGVGEQGDPEYYVVRKHPTGVAAGNQAPGFGRSAVVIARSATDTQNMARWMRSEFASLDPSLPVNIQSMDTRVDKLRQAPRFNAVLLTLFALLGLLLAGIGLYGVMAYLVTQRTQEIGVRMALGATPFRIARLVLSYAARWTIAGLVVGLVASFWGTRLLRTMLFHVAPNDPLMMITAPSVLLLIAFVAAWLPSRRAARVDPMVALRTE